MVLVLPGFLWVKKTTNSLEGRNTVVLGRNRTLVLVLLSEVFLWQTPPAVANSRLPCQSQAAEPPSPQGHPTFAGLFSSGAVEEDQGMAFFRGLTSWNR